MYMAHSRSVYWLHPFLRAYAFLGKDYVITTATLDQHIDSSSLRTLMIPFYGNNEISRNGDYA